MPAAKKAMAAAAAAESNPPITQVAIHPKAARGKAQKGAGKR